MNKTPTIKPKPKVDQSKSTGNSVQNEQPNILINKNPVKVKDIKFVCDNMLEVLTISSRTKLIINNIVLIMQALGRKLRLQGIDTSILQSYENSDRCIEIAEKEKRIILTASKNKIQVSLVN